MCSVEDYRSSFRPMRGAPNCKGKGLISPYFPPFGACRSAPRHNGIEDKRGVGKGEHFLNGIMGTLRPFSARKGNGREGIMINTLAQLAQLAARPETDVS